MMSQFLFFMVLAVICTVAICRPQYKDEDFDYRMFEDDNAVTMDTVLLVIIVCFFINTAELFIEMTI
ncbi:hypothetical protein NECAME_12152 [Necator americanus]|uniref:Uncharacterized protein n=1 Tax=Necator americanus TaxID=51031 RepID=W2T3I5_NECAM|nr:hypothetical protein NECAME_12152 [Necator americanus]ETN75766.1 hypothetical protein NECAME_12152 [Necator americanus]